jgi:hypothetical protein
VRFTSAGIRGALERIEAEVASWPGVAVKQHRFGGIEFRVGDRPIGHLHGDRRAEIRGRSSRYIRSDEDADEVIGLLRMNYERAARRTAERAAG